MNDGFRKFIAAPERDRLDIFLAASRRLGTAVQNVEKDFWVCWTLDVLYHGLLPGVRVFSSKVEHLSRKPITSFGVFPRTWISPY
ncbi:MAG: hypothetical protein WB795_11465, partial [Candidatus Acidiferrales bacterium]